MPGRKVYCDVLVFQMLKLAIMTIEQSHVQTGSRMEYRAHADVFRGRTIGNYLRGSKQSTSHVEQLECLPYRALNVATPTPSSEGQQRLLIINS